MPGFMYVGVSRNTVSPCYVNAIIPSTHTSGARNLERRPRRFIKSPKAQGGIASCFVMPFLSHRRRAGKHVKQWRAWSIPRTTSPSVPKFLGVEETGRHRFLNTGYMVAGAHGLTKTPTMRRCPIL